MRRNDVNQLSTAFVPRLSRRSFLRSAAATAACVPILSEAHFADAAAAREGVDVPEFHPQGVYIDANENPLGPCEIARQALVDIIPNGGRYARPLYANLIKLFAQQVGVPADHVALYDGSSAPLAFTVLAFTSPSRGLVTADPTYEAAGESARATNAPIHAVPLASDYSHEVEKMLAADRTPGVIYICNPNNPTGTITPKDKIDWLIEKKPAGAIVLIDEAYIHFSDAQSAVEHVRLAKDVIILRTFSKIYGMAGLRCGFAIGRPDLLKKLQYFGMNPMPVTGMIAAQASLMDTDLVPTRRQKVADSRNDTFRWLRQNNYSFIPSQSNCFMIDVKRPGAQIFKLMASDGVYIGRTWPVWPTFVRVSVGLPEEMELFRRSFRQAMETPATAGMDIPSRPVSLRAPGIYA